MANVWTNGWTAQLKWPKKWRPGNGSEMVGKHASIGRSPSLLHDGNSTNFTRQSKIDGILVLLSEFGRESCRNAFVEKSLWLQNTNKIANEIIWRNAC